VIATAPLGRSAGKGAFAWDREVPGDDERALAAHDRLAALWAEQGGTRFPAPFSRTDVSLRTDA
jgi:hypothetical protein